jgi:arylsulfatase A-like enzyme
MWTTLRDDIMARPNILWVCTDQQRYDTLGCYGNEHVETPTIDQLAADGVRFEGAYCQSPVCAPSRASFLTGRYPRTTRVRQNGQALPDDERPVTRRLADAGYTCGLAGKLHVSPAHPKARDSVPNAERRTDDGYADFHWSHHPGASWPTNEYNQWLRERDLEFESEPFRGSEYVETSMPAEHHQTTWCAKRAVTFIEENAAFDEPWLYSVNPFDPHAGFNPPREYLERHLDRLADVPLPNHEAGERADKPLFQRHPESEAAFPFEEMDESDHRTVRAAYWAMCELVDDAVGRLVDALDRTGQREETLVVFTSDHGEMLGDHGIYLKGPYFYEPQIRVPLVVAGPGVESGVDSDALVELVDLAPTLLDAAGVEDHAGIHGGSLWPILSGDADPDEGRDDVYCEYYHALERSQFYDELPWSTTADTDTDADLDFWRPLADVDIDPDYHDDFDAGDRVLPYATMVRTDRYKLVSYHGLDAGELYDLIEDPTETHNRYDDPEYAAVKTEMLERLADRMAGTVDPLPRRVAPW